MQAGGRLRRGWPLLSRALWQLCGRHCGLAGRGSACQAPWASRSKTGLARGRGKNRRSTYKRRANFEQARGPADGSVALSSFLAARCIALLSFTAPFLPMIALHPDSSAPAPAPAPSTSTSTPVLPHKYLPVPSPTSRRSSLSTASADRGDYKMASAKRNADFHALFRSVPDADRLIDGNSPLYSPAHPFTHTHSRRSQTTAAPCRRRY